MMNGFVSLIHACFSMVHALVLLMKAFIFLIRAQFAWMKPFAPLIYARFKLNGALPSFMNASLTPRDPRLVRIPGCLTQKHTFRLLIHSQ